MYQAESNGHYGMQVNRYIAAWNAKREVFIELTGINVTGFMLVIRFVVCKADSDSVVSAEVANPWISSNSWREPSVVLRRGNIMESRAKIKVFGVG